LCEIELQCHNFDIYFDELTIEKPKSHGNFASVYEGLYNQAPVAIKQIECKKQNDTIYILRELKALRELSHRHEFSHPRLISFYGACFHQNSIYLVTELAARSLDSKNDFKTNELLQIALQVAEGLQYLHKTNFLHRDLKPANILLLNNNQVKLCDFGLARVLHGEKISGTVCGSPFFMAPELDLRKGITEYTNKIDIFAFGVTLWSILHPTSLKIIPVSELRPSIKSDIYPWVQKLIIRCWDQDPSLRPSAEEIVNIFRSELMDKSK